MQSQDNDSKYDFGGESGEDEWESSEEEQVMELIDRQRQHEASISIDWD
jgi:hypothetical protein